MFKGLIALNHVVVKVVIIIFNWGYLFSEGCVNECSLWGLIAPVCLYITSICWELYGCSLKKWIMHKERGEGEERVGDEMPRGLKPEKEANLWVTKLLGSWQAKHFSHFCLDTHWLMKHSLLYIDRPDDWQLKCLPHLDRNRGDKNGDDVAQKYEVAASDECDWTVINIISAGLALWFFPNSVPLLLALSITLLISSPSSNDTFTD